MHLNFVGLSRHKSTTDLLFVQVNIADNG